MNFKIVFDNSGDFIPFYAVRPEVIEYYVHELEKANLNKFHDHTFSIGKNIAQKIDTLHSSIEKVNQWAYELMDIKVDQYSNREEYLNQRNLNKIHSDYVVSKRNFVYDIDQKRKDYNFQGYAEIIHDMFSDDIRFPQISDVLGKLDKEVSYCDINMNLHELENIFRLITFNIQPISWVAVENPFGSSILDNNICNFRLGFNHVGRTLYNKYQNFDDNLEFEDENSFDELVGRVEISFLHPQTIPLSKEYVAWCNRHDKIPSGDYLNIGNIPDLAEKLYDYRLIIFRNLVANNSFTIQL